MSATKIIKVDFLNPDPDLLRDAAKSLKEGGLVIIPTETVYGIAANMLNQSAVDRLYEVKKRPKDKPFSLHIADKNKLQFYVKDIPSAAYKLIDKFWPGPLTLILNAKSGGTLGVRLPDCEVARKLISLADVPVVCPSANLSDKPAPVNIEEALADLDGVVEYAIDAGKSKIGIESTLVDLTKDKAEVLREGAIKKADILKVISTKNVLFVCTGNSCRSVIAEALLKDRLKKLKRDDVEVYSAGLMASGGMGATESAKQVLWKEGIDVSGHRSHQINRQMILRSDIILAMSRAHEAGILEIAPEARNKVFLLKEFARIRDEDLDIPDPIGLSVEFYSHTLDVIKEAVNRIVEII